MHGRSNMTRKMSPQKQERKNRLNVKRVTPGADESTSRVDVGDWALAQDEDGHLVIHNVMTGNRVIIARA